MWPMPPFNKKYVIIYFSPHHITCTWIESAGKKAKLKAIKTETIQNLELEHLIIYNPSHINSIIQSFIKSHKLQNAYSLFCLSGPSLKEQFITSDTVKLNQKSLDTHDQQAQISWKHLVWDYSYLYPTQNGQFVFYVAGISRELIFQYQLLAMRNNLNLIALSPATTALLNLYQEYKGSDFRQGQLGIDLAYHNNDVTKIFNHKTLNNVIYNTKHINQTDTEALLASIGLYYMRDKLNA